MIVFRFPPDPIVLVNRLVGLPGDHLHISDAVVILNSRRIAEAYVQHLAGSNASAFFSNFPFYADTLQLIVPVARKVLERYATSCELIIPEGGYFVLGDKREYSYDSRSWGLVRPSQIIGLAQEIVSSEDPNTTICRAHPIHLPIE